MPGRLTHLLDRLSFWKTRPIRVGGIAVRKLILAASGSTVIDKMPAGARTSTRGTSNFSHAQKYNMEGDPTSESRCSQYSRHVAFTHSRCHGCEEFAVPGGSSVIPNRGAAARIFSFNSALGGAVSKGADNGSAQLSTN
jgi:hypothetical protein